MTRTFAGKPEDGKTKPRSKPSPHQREDAIVRNGLEMITEGRQIFRFDITHWNAFVANLEMHGSGTFYDPRLANAEQYPIAARAGFFNVRNQPDLITGKLAPLHFYQLAIPAPKPPSDTFDAAAAARGEALFSGAARCATCHVPPLFTEPGWNMHTPAEIGIDSFQADRSPDRRYRTSPLKGLWTHQKGGFYHDGRFATLLDVVNHYNTVFGLGLSEAQKRELVESLKSL